MSADMSETLRRYYLSAMGIQSWVKVNTTAEHAAVPALSRQEAVEHQPKQPSGITVATLAEQVAQCRRCSLSAAAAQRRIGLGSQTANLMLIFIAPDTVAVEKNAGKFLAAESEFLLEKMLHAIELDSHDVYITSLLKCPVPASDNTANPAISSAEIEACRPWLNQQIKQIKPQMLLVMGLTVAQCLLQTTGGQDDLRLHQHDYAGVPVVVSYAVKDLLENPPQKRKAWADLQYLQKLLRAL